MDDHIYKIIELAGSAPDSIENAIQNAISRASQSLHDLRWFEVSRPAATSRATRWPTIKW